MNTQEVISRRDRSVVRRQRPVRPLGTVRGEEPRALGDGLAFLLLTLATGMVLGGTGLAVVFVLDVVKALP